MVDHTQECKDFAEYTHGPIRKSRTDPDKWCLYMHESPAGMWFLEKKITHCMFCGKDLYK